MKKILIITNHSFMFWQFRRELVEAMVQQGHRVILVCPFGDRIGDLRKLGCELIHTPLDRRSVSPVKEIKLMRQYKQIIRQHMPDMVITYSIKPNIYAGTVCRKMNIPHCVNVQGLGTAFQTPLSAWFAAKLYRNAIKGAKAVFFENEENARYFRENKIVAPEKQVILHGAGINMEHYALQPYPDNDRVHFLYLGRLMREKGVDELFWAVRRLCRDGEKFFLDLVGFFEDSYSDQVAELEAMGVCQFHGFQIDARPFYAAADCVVLPSYHEGMSNVLLEAAAIGRPLITSDIPGCREAVDKDTSGFTCAVKDPQALYEAMKRFLRLTREEREAMGLAGNARMYAQFNKKDVVEQTMSAIFKESEHEAVH